jgi:hypothetical protein
MRSISWRITSIYCLCRKYWHTALADYTVLETIDVFSLHVTVVEEYVVCTNSSAAIRPMEKQDPPPPLTRRAKTPPGSSHVQQ